MDLCYRMENTPQSPTRYRSDQKHQGGGGVSVELLSGHLRGSALQHPAKHPAVVMTQGNDKWKKGQ